MKHIYAFGWLAGQPEKGYTCIAHCSSPFGPDYTSLHQMAATWTGRGHEVYWYDGEVANYGYPLEATGELANAVQRSGWKPKP